MDTRRVRMAAFLNANRELFVVGPESNVDQHLVGEGAGFDK